MVPTDDLLAVSPRRGALPARPKVPLVGFIAALAVGQLLVAVLVLGSHGVPGVLGGDFIAYYGAGRAALAGDWDHLYALPVQLRYQQALLQHSGLPAGGPSMIPFDYPPPAALLFLPLALLPAPVAAVCWLVINAALVGGAWRVMARRLGDPTATTPTGLWSSAAALSLFALLPVAWGLLSGQPVGAILLLAVLSFQALMARQDGRAGLWLALLAVFKPQLVLVPLLGLLVLGRPRAVVGAVLTGLALLGSSLALVGVDGLLAYMQLLRRIDPTLGSTAYSIRTEAMVNWRAWIAAIPGIDSQTALLLTAAAAIVTVGVALLLGARQRSPAGFAPAYLALTAAGLVAGYHSHYQDLVVLLPPVAVVLAARGGRGPLSAFGVSPPGLGESQGRAIGSPSRRSPQDEVPSKPPSSRLRSSPPGLGERPGERALRAAVLLLVGPSVAWLLLGVFALGWLPLWTFCAVPGLALLIFGAGRAVTMPSPLD